MCWWITKSNYLTVKSEQIQIPLDVDINQIKKKIAGQRIIFSDWMDAQTDLILLTVTHGIVLFLTCTG